MKGKIFNTQEVQAILAGNKRMFMEVIKENIYWRDDENSFFFGKEKMKGYPYQWTDKAPYQVGQKIFCKEKWGANKRYDDFEYFGDRISARSNSAESCPEWASRLTLLIKEVSGVERLQDISEEDAKSEGVESKFDWSNRLWTYKKEFIDRWNATHKKPEEKFEANPFVFIYSFEVV